MRTPVRNQFLGVHRGSCFCASSVLPSRGVPLPITTGRRGGIRVMAGAPPRLLTPPRAAPGAGRGRTPPRRRGGRPPRLPRGGAPLSPQPPPREGGGFFSPRRGAPPP